MSRLRLCAVFIAAVAAGAHERLHRERKAELLRRLSEDSNDGDAYLQLSQQMWLPQSAMFAWLSGENVSKVCLADGRALDQCGLLHEAVRCGDDATRAVASRTLRILSELAANES